ncbi:MAG: cytochrome c [Betaproteobacteria bacterium]|nr:cytochrome c [Betaproteobacteria bacterium]
MGLLHRILVASLGLVLAGPVLAADVAAGAEKAKTICAACHGADGSGVPAFPDYPKLAGQHQDYLQRTLREYKTGGRKNAIMAPMAQTLTTKEIADVAAYFASQPGTLHVRR